MFLYEATATILNGLESRAARQILARRYALVRLTDIVTLVLPANAAHRPGRERERAAGSRQGRWHAVVTSPACSAYRATWRREALVMPPM
ncbi:hypothetical protein ACWD5V_29345 [Streptomyces sp. NPDC002523]